MISSLENQYNPTTDPSQLQFSMSLEPSLDHGLQGEAIRQRDAVLQKLLGTDYEYAQEAGLIDAFFINPNTGEDGLMHVLTGTVAQGPTGAKIPAGYHHEPSSLDTETYVDRSHLEDAGHDRRKHYREYPFEPYQARVVIGGLKKMSVHTDKAGNRTIGPANSNMFPKEYDPFTVLKTVVDARDHRNRDNDKLLDGNKVVSEGSSVMLDGKTPMRIRMILDAATDKVISAYPARVKQAGFMNLHPDEIRQHLGLR